jgi:hypothetical protein
MKLIALALLFSSPTDIPAAVREAAAEFAHAALVDHVKQAYASALADGSHELPGAVEVGPEALRGDALAAYENYVQVGVEQGVDWVPLVFVAEVAGHTVYELEGFPSDVGSEFAFFDAEGSALATAYEGLGENPGPDGVDWGS